LPQEPATLLKVALSIEAQSFGVALLARPTARMKSNLFF